MKKEHPTNVWAKWFRKQDIHDTKVEKALDDAYQRKDKKAMERWLKAWAKEDKQELRRWERDFAR